MEFGHSFHQAEGQSGGDLYTQLLQYGKRSKRYAMYDRWGNLFNRVSTEERPQMVEQRQRLGDWEIDALVAKDSAALF